MQENPIVTNWVQVMRQIPGPVFLPVLEHLAEDEHLLVATLAILYRDRLEQVQAARRGQPIPRQDGE